jgi:hypothetical protein
MFCVTKPKAHYYGPEKNDLFNGFQTVSKPVSNFSTAGANGD